MATHTPPLLRIEYERRKRRLSQTSFAAMVGGINQQAICDIEHGVLRPRRPQMERLSAFLGVPADQLLVPVIPMEVAAK